MSAHAVPIAVIDSGNDFEHPDLKSFAWVNPRDSKSDGKDDEHNGMRDDVNGWNFADNNNKLIERKLMGQFSPDVYKFFDVQFKKFAGTITEEEINWVKSKREDKNFLEEMNVYGNFMHGTHVSGIVSKNAPKNEIMGVKLLPTVVKKPKSGQGILEWAAKYNFPVAAVSKATQGINPDSKIVETLIIMGLKSLAKAQSEMLIPVGRYVRLSGAKVANCSFGTSPTMIKMLLGQLFKMLFKKDMAEEKLNMYTSVFMKELAAEGRKFSVIANKTLFVIAAGNDGADNDYIPAYPAGIERDNAITVAATFGVSQLAVFSNYGAKSVDVAAPGVGILSSEPGTGHVRVSGTSQAAPFVSNVAGRILDQNPALSPLQVKQILMLTVDEKAALKGKVVSGGVVNPERATLAAQLSRGMSVKEAAMQAKMQVTDVMETMTMPIEKVEPKSKDHANFLKEAAYLPMPQFIQY